MIWYGIWCKDADGGRGAWLREYAGDANSANNGIVAFCDRAAAERRAEQVRAGAERRAARMHQSSTYAQMRKADWCEVRLLEVRS